MQSLNILKVDEIINKGCEFFGVTIDDIRRFDRKREIVEKRQMLIKLVKDNSMLTLKQIGIRFGGRDHTTIIYSLQIVNSLNRAYPEYRDQYSQLEKYIFG